MEEELNKLLSRLSFSGAEIPQIFLSYQQLKKNSRAYYESLIDTGEVLSPKEFLQNLSVEKKEWYSLSTYSLMLSTDYSLEQLILQQDRQGVINVVHAWHDDLRERFLTVLQAEQPKLDLAPLVSQLYSVCLYFLRVKLIALIEDEAQFFTELMELGDPQLLVHFAQRLQSRKSKLQLQKYMIRRIFSRLPEDFPYPDVLSFLNYFAHYADLITADQCMDIIPQVERLKIGFRKKVPALLRCINVLEEQAPQLILEQSWHYPRLQVRNLFLSSFFHVANNKQIREYWENHPSETSRQVLLSVLLGKSTDPYFLDILFDTYPNDRRIVITALTIYPIEEVYEIIDFLKKLPDRFSTGDIETMFNSYWTRDYLLFHQILSRIDELAENSLSDVIRAKFRLSGIKFR